MNITHIVTSFGVGGIETMLVDILNEQSLNANLSLIIINERANKDLINKISKGIKIYHVKRPNGSKNPIYLYRLNYFIYKAHPDIIHCHGESIIRFLYAKAYSKKTKVVLTVHAIGIKSNCLLRYDKIFAISNAVKDDLYNQYHVESKLVYNGVYTSLIKEKAKNDIKNNRFKIVNVSRIDIATKGQDLLLEAINIIVNKLGVKTVQLVLIGEGPSLKQLKDLASKLGIADYVDFKGFKDRTYIYNQLSCYDLFVQPSRNEGFGLTIAEAMLAKIPVLVSDIDGPMELINNGELGSYFRSNDANNLAQKVYEILNNNTIIGKDTIEKAYARAKVDFDIKNTAKNYLLEYKLCVG